jgi:hypothetical protein
MAGKGFCAEVFITKQKHMITMRILTFQKYQKQIGSKSHLLNSAMKFIDYSDFSQFQNDYSVSLPFF